MNPRLLSRTRSTRTRSNRTRSTRTRSTPLQTARLLAVVALLLAVGCDSLPGRPDPADRYQRPDEVMDFATLFATNCSGCHGADGRRGPAAPLGDPHYGALAQPAYLERVIGDGVKGTPMPAFAQARGGGLTAEQVQVIVQGIRAWGAGLTDSSPETPPLVAPSPSLVAPSPVQGPGSQARGKVAYAAFCADCHGPAGEGGEKAGSLVEPAYLGLVSDQALRTAVIVGREDLGMPGWQASQGRRISAGEINDVVAWLAAQRPSRAQGRPSGDGR